MRGKRVPMIWISSCVPASALSTGQETHRDVLVDGKAVAGRRDSAQQPIAVIDGVSGMGGCDVTIDDHRHEAAGDAFLFLLQQGTSPDEVTFVESDEPFEACLQRRTFGNQVCFPVPVALLQTHRFVGERTEVDETQVIAGCDDAIIDRAFVLDGHVDFPGHLARKANAHDLGLAWSDIDRLGAEPGKRLVREIGIGEPCQELA